LQLLLLHWELPQFLQLISQQQFVTSLLPQRVPELPAVSLGTM
jgi:hypothetical protein